ncbi:hypothetical protein [Tenacibaculum amylolyticum]|uniref:hypothetical protein n=1 Tax=Tenacibaculum amylolyticum TaxID=104269 RepID=UPI003896583B
MIKNHLTRKTIAIFLLLNFLNTIVPYNALYANNNGPNAPEAASFEPVDATDMVNLSTGSFTYVLPLLNVPSPEGGYPLALAYHAGIAMDQESSIIGLGWNLNPGSINRNVNGAPDDYSSALTTEHFWDKTQTITEYSASVGWSNGVTSVGLGLSWGSHKSLGGQVSLNVAGARLNVGTEGLGVGLGANVFGVSLGVNASTNGGVVGTAGIGINISGLSFGVNANTNGNVEGTAGVSFDKNGTGFNISTNGTFGFSVGSKSKSGSISSLDISFSSSGIGIGVKSGRFKSGTGFNLGFQNTSKMGDYTTTTSGWSIPLFVPVGLGFLTFSFGKTEFKFYRDNFIRNYIDGPIHFYDGTSDIPVYKVSCYGVDHDDQNVSCGTLTTTNRQAALDYADQGGNDNAYDCQCEINELEPNESYMDVLELPVSSGDFVEKEETLLANPNFPNYDKFNVQAQGISGAITARVFENKALFSISGQESSDGSKLDYLVNGAQNVASQFKFTKKAFFYFENEISTYLETPQANFSYNSSILNTLTGTSYNPTTQEGSKSENINRRKTANYIEYYTNKEILEEENRLLSEGYIKPSVNGFEREKMPSSGIGAFKITAIDGKTYHYSLPVYNHEIVQRTYGMNTNYGTSTPRKENESYFEKRQMEPYATHWLLTAVTGPDYVDKNGDGIVNVGDYGYWVDFEYGKYSDGFIWSNSYGKNITTNPNNNEIKTWIRGRKDQYYLDRVLTRTHSAIFVKSPRKDGKSINFQYDYASSANSYVYNSFTMPSQFPLKLDKIVLVERENDNIIKSTSSSVGQVIEVSYPRIGGKRYSATINNLNNVIDNSDNFSSLEGEIISSIEFDNDNYSLVRGTPNSDAGGRLTLNAVHFKGKNETSVIPPYTFDYNNSSYSFEIDDKDDFGYYRNDNSLWSLEEIITPTGGKIKVDYENHVIDPVMKSNVIYTRAGKKNKVTMDYDQNGIPVGFTVDSESDFGLQVGDEVDVKYFYECMYEDQDCGGPQCGVDSVGESEYDGKGTITQSLGNNKFYGTLNGTVTSYYAGGDVPVQSWTCNYSRTTASVEYEIKNSITNGGIRVKRVSTVDENNRYYSMDYSYGENGNGVGYVTYLPYAPELAKDLPYSSELPPPIPMYEYVTTTTSTTEGEVESTREQYGTTTEYRFNVLKEKTEGEARFGDFYEIVTEEVYGTTNSSTQLRKFTIKDNLATLGQLLHVKTFNEKDQLLSRIDNDYYGLEGTPENIGITQESYQTYKKVTKKDKSVTNLAVGSTRIIYPAMLNNSKQVSGGESYTSEFNDFDPITGQARETYSYSSDGTKFRTRGIQAFREYSGMGSKVDNINNKNMLSQSAGDINYVQKNGDWKVVGANVTTWNNNWIYPFNNSTTESSNDVWRKHQTYVWNGQSNSDGTYISFSNFDFNNNANNTDWELVSETTRYNQFSEVLEIKDVNDNFAATKMGDNYTKIIASANAAYDDMYYSGAEYIENSHNYFEGNVMSGTALGRNTSFAHTGKFSIQIEQNKKSFEVNVPSRAGRNTSLKQRFKVSVWVKKGGEDNAKILLNQNQISFNNSEKVYAGNWVLLNGYVTIPQGGASVAVTSISGTIYVDDFRLHPIASNMVSYVYNEWDEVSYITGGNGLSTHYKYDPAGKLLETQTEYTDKVDGDGTGGFKRIATNSYNYKRNNQ